MSLDEALRAYGTRAKVAKALDRKSIEPLLIIVADVVYISELASYVLYDITRTVRLRRTLLYAESRWIGAFNRKVKGSKKIADHRKKLELLGRYLYKVLRSHGHDIVFCRVLTSTNKTTPAMLLVRDAQGNVTTIDLPRTLAQNFRPIAHQLFERLVSQLPALGTDRSEILGLIAPGTE